MHADVIVIGLGAMGSATLWQLARRKVRALGLDRWQPPHVHGSTHGETRLTRIAVGEGAEYVPFARRSHDIWRELEAATGRALFHQNGLLIYGSRAQETAFHGSPDFLGTTVRVAQQVFGESRSLLSAPAIKQRFPQFRVGPEDVGYYEPEAGMLFPEACVAAQLTLARALGAELRTGETVLAIAPRAGGGVRVTTDAGAYEAARAIVSVGAWVARFLPPRWAARFTVTRQVLGWFEPAAHAEQHLPSVMPNFIRLPVAGEPLVYGFPRIDAAVADMKVAAEAPGPPRDPDSIDRAVTAHELAQLHHDASRAVDLKAGATRATTCLYTVTPGSRFVIDTHPDWPDVVVVSPCSGHGFKHSAAIGECVAASAVGEQPPVDLSPFAFERLHD